MINARLSFALPMTRVFVNDLGSLSELACVLLHLLQQLPLVLDMRSNAPRPELGLALHRHPLRCEEELFQFLELLPSTRADNLLMLLALVHEPFALLGCLLDFQHSLLQLGDLFLFLSIEPQGA
jgi:hypothetical protein